MTRHYPQKQYPPKVRELRELARKKRHLTRFSLLANHARARHRVENAILRGAKRTLIHNRRRFTVAGVALVRQFAASVSGDWCSEESFLDLRTIRRSGMAFEAIQKLVGKAK